MSTITEQDSSGKIIVHSFDEYARDLWTRLLRVPSERNKRLEALRYLRKPRKLDNA